MTGARQGSVEEAAGPSDAVRIPARDSNPRTSSIACLRQRAKRHAAGRPANPYGPRTTCYNRFVRWRQAGVWDQIMDALAAGHDVAVQMIDTSVVRVHQHGACIADNNHQDMGRSRVRAGAGYCRSFVGAPTSTTCRLKFSDRWVLSRL